MSDPEFLDLEDVLLIHEEQIAKYGGRTACETWDSSSRPLPCRRRALGESSSTPTVLAAVVFLELNGFIVEEPPLRFHEAMIALAERRLDKDGLAAMLRNLSLPVAAAGE